MLALGTKTSAMFTNILTGVNLLNIAIMCSGAFVLADFRNWNLSKSEIPKDAGEGGFLPYGWAGVARSAGTCFFGYVGFDSIAATGEESHNPRRNIPLSILLTLVVVCFVYIIVASSITLAVPYYAADIDTPFPSAFKNAGWPVLRWIVAIGAIFALFASLIGAAYPLPRVLYSMASDGMFFRFFSAVHKKTHVPLWAILVSWIATSIMVLFFDLDQLMDMMSIGTLMAYIIVGVCVVQIRYRREKDNGDVQNEPGTMAPFQWNCKNVYRATFNTSKEQHPTELSNVVVTICQFIFLFSATVLFFVIGEGEILNTIAGLTSVAVLVLVILVVTIIVSLQPRNKVQRKSFAVPIVPWFPYLSVLTCMYFMATLDLSTWIRFLIWNIVGLLIHFLYNMKHSSLNPNYQKMLEEQQQKKAEAQQKKAEAQQKKAEAQQKKAEAQQKKVEAQQKKAEAQQKKVEAQQKKDEAQK